MVTDIVCPFMCSINNPAMHRARKLNDLHIHCITMPRTLSNMGPVQLHNMHKNMLSLIDSTYEIIIDYNNIDIRYAMK